MGAARVALPALLLRTGDAQGALEAAVGGLAWLRDRQVGSLAAAPAQLFLPRDQCRWDCA